MRRHAAVLLGASLAVAACSADEFATPDGGGDGGADAPVVVDSGADVRDSVAPPADAPADAPPKSWCLEPSQISAEACADFDEVDIQQGFSKGASKPMACGAAAGADAKLVPGGGGGQLELAGVSTPSTAPEASCAFQFLASTKNSWVIDFDMPLLNTSGGGNKPTTLVSFVFDANKGADCAFDLQFIPNGTSQVQLLWLRNSVGSSASAPTTVSHVQIKVDYNTGSDEFAVVTKADGLTIPIGFSQGCGSMGPRTTIVGMHLFSPTSNGSTTLRFDKLTVLAL